MSTESLLQISLVYLTVFEMLVYKFHLPPLKKKKKKARKHKMHQNGYLKWKGRATKMYKGKEEAYVGQ